MKMSSLRVTVPCLIGYFVLVGWGTLYQVEHGLYAAQNRFFYSWIFLVWEVIPFPGAQLISWVFGANLLAAALVMKFAFRLRKIGILCIHYGLALLLLGSFVVHVFSQESYLALHEGESSNLTKDYYRWELVLWEEAAQGDDALVTNEVFACDFDLVREGGEVVFESFRIILSVRKAYDHCASVMGRGGSPRTSRILRALAPPKEPSEAIAGFEGVLHMADGKDVTCFLWGGDEVPMRVDRSVGQGPLWLQLRHKSYVLPVTVELVDFTKEMYQGVDMAKSYESEVMIGDGTVKRSVRIHMNHPLRFKDYTVYQASYREDSDGRGKESIFAVVKNKNRWIPYVASGMMAFGLCFHFGYLLVMRVWGDRKKKKNLA